EAAAVKEVKQIVRDIEPDVKLKEITNRKTGEIDSEEENESGIQRLKLLQLGIGAAFFAAAVLLKLSAGVELAIYLTAYALVGGEVLIKSIRNIFRGQVFDENFLMSLATIGAFAIGEYSEGVAVMIFYQIGEMFQDLAVDRSRRSIKELMDIRPEYANLVSEDRIIQVPPEDVPVGAYIIVKPGERVPLDGRITEGRSMLDTSALTGESAPREANAGDEILAGFINNSGAITVEVSKEFGESTVSKILDMVQNASSKKSHTENFITKFARYYTPAVVFSALALAFVPPLVLQGEAFSDWIYRALIFLVVSCPCALVISIPLGFFGGIGGASKNGVLIKGSNYLDVLNQVDTIVFDKTGTLTKGVFKVTEVKALGEMKEEELLKYAAYVESYSGHPIALSILKAYGSETVGSEISDYEEIPGHGVRAEVFGKRVAAGNTKMMQLEGISAESPDIAGALVHIAIEGAYAGYIVISDEIKDDAERAVRLLKASGIKKTVMLTGD
ncbi:MAG TPA: heavy metal translocating P-type ATPase, partial [Bacillota bacterium]|nr:heavy metal translocating P-type ATPase [Bacillota bacterium]